MKWPEKYYQKSDYGVFVEELRFLAVSSSKPSYAFYENMFTGEPVRIYKENALFTTEKECLEYVESNLEFMLDLCRKKLRG